MFDWFSGSTQRVVIGYLFLAIGFAATALGYFNGSGISLIYIAPMCFIVAFLVFWFGIGDAEW